jgi:hypothetical protein
VIGMLIVGPTKEAFVCETLEIDHQVSRNADLRIQPHESLFGKRLLVLIVVNILKQHTLRSFVGVQP